MADYFHEVKVMSHPGGSPWPESISLTSQLFSQSMIVHHKSSREPDASVKTCKKLLQNRSFLVSSGASETEIETRIGQEG